MMQTKVLLTAGVLGFVWVFEMLTILDERLDVRQVFYLKKILSCVHIYCKLPFYTRLANRADALFTYAISSKAHN